MWQPEFSPDIKIIAWKVNQHTCRDVGKKKKRKKRTWALFTSHGWIIAAGWQGYLSAGFLIRQNGILQCGKQKAAQRFYRPIHVCWSVCYKGSATSKQVPRRKMMKNDSAAPVQEVLKNNTYQIKHTNKQNRWSMFPFPNVAHMYPLSTLNVTCNQPGSGEVKSSIPSSCFTFCCTAKEFLDIAFDYLFWFFYYYCLFWSTFFGFIRFIFVFFVCVCFHTWFNCHWCKEKE